MQGLAWFAMQGTRCLAAALVLGLAASARAQDCSKDSDCPNGYECDLAPSAGSAPDCDPSGTCDPAPEPQPPRGECEPAELRCLVDADCPSGAHCQIRGSDCA